MNRIDAISWLCQYQLKNFTKEERADSIFSLWSIDEEDEEFHILPQFLQTEMKENDEPIQDVCNERYDSLILENLRFSYIGLKNEYIESKILMVYNEKISIDGVPEELYNCPCCGYKTLTRKNALDVCHICLWEDDGHNIESLDVYSSPNHMTLGEARETFSKILKESLWLKGDITSNDILPTSGYIKKENSFVFDSINRYIK